MTIQRRVLLWLILITSVMWLLAIGASYLYAEAEINELFDTQQVRLAQHTLVNAVNLREDQPLISIPVPPVKEGNADPADLMTAAWTTAGAALTPSDQIGTIAFRSDRTGFETQQINGQDWRVYYLADATHKRVVAVAQLAEERTEMLGQLLLAYMVPWTIILPLTIAGIAFALNRTFRPLRQLSATIETRSADDLQQISVTGVPTDVKPLISAMNHLFARITATLAHERRLTADASHELRSPIAALQAQWDAWNLAKDAPTRERAQRQISSTIRRLTRMIGQLLSLSALETNRRNDMAEPIHWPTVIENALSDVLPLVGQRNADIETEWPPTESKPIPLNGSNALLSMMLRNLLDNALRYGPEQNLITVRLTENELSVTDHGPGMPAMVLERLGERFVRPAGQRESGSGIGLSLVLRIARMHGLDVQFDSLNATQTAQGAQTGGTRVSIRLKSTKLR